MDMQGAKFLDSPHEGSVIEGSLPSHERMLETLKTTEEICLSKELIRGRRPFLLEGGNRVHVFVTGALELESNRDFHVLPSRNDAEHNLHTGEGAVWVWAVLRENCTADDFFGTVQLREGTRLFMDGRVVQKEGGGGIPFSGAPVVTTTPMICMTGNSFSNDFQQPLPVAA